MSLDLPGFADPVTGTQAAFRAILDAMSRPGTIREAGTGLAPPAPLGAAMAASLLTLVDAETRLFIDPGCAGAAEWIAFHCGAAAASSVADADFVVTRTMPDLALLADGSDDAPQAGATLIVEVGGFDRGQRLAIAGPGLKAPATLLVDGLPAGFAGQWAANHAKFPRGVDLILCAGSALVALPRSLRVTGEAD